MRKMGSIAVLDVRLATSNITIKPNLTALTPMQALSTDPYQINMCLFEILAIPPAKLATIQATELDCRTLEYGRHDKEKT